MSASLPAITPNHSLTADGRSGRPSPVPSTDANPPRQGSGAFTSRLPVPSAHTKRPAPVAQKEAEEKPSRGNSAEKKAWMQLSSIEQAEAKEKQDQLAAKIQDGFREIMALDQLLKDKQNEAHEEKVETPSVRIAGVAPVTTASTSSLDEVSEQASSTFVTDLPYLSSLPYELPAQMENVDDATPALMDDQQLKDNLVTAQKDFLKRNMELGADARYFHALSEVEKQRLEDLLQEEEEQDQTLESIDEDGTKSVTFTHMTAQTNKTGFAPDMGEMRLLESIDEKLKKLIPTQEWEARSIIFAPIGNNSQLDSVASLSQLGAPLSRGSSMWWTAANRATSVVNKNVDEVMSSDPLKALKDFSLERKKLMDLDERLQALTQAQETSQETVSRAQIEALLFQALKEERDLLSDKTMLAAV